MKWHPLLQTHKLAFFFQTPPPSNTNLCQGEEEVREEAEWPKDVSPPRRSGPSINIQQAELKLNHVYCLSQKQ